jgi:hypothetical protein
VFQSGTSSSPDLTVAISAAAVAATMIGWQVTAWHARKAQRLKDQLDHVNKQLAEFYGPLYVSCQAGKTAYDRLLKKVGRKSGIFDPPPADENTKREYFLWMRHVLTPLNDFREKLILEKAYLTRESYTPTEILEFVSHVATYRAILAKWAVNDFTEEYSKVEFPQALDEYAERSFKQLKADQARLMGLLKIDEQR